MGADDASTGRRTLVPRLLSGPAAFAAVHAAPLTGLAPEAHFTVSAYAWVLAWWVTQPVPWIVASFLPFVLLPAAGVLPFTGVAAGYGHTVLPYLTGVMLFGHAFRKHGLARRIALAALCLPGVARSGGGIVLALLIVSAVMSAVVSDLVVIVTMTPIALSIARSVAADAGRMATAASLAVLYGAAAGGLATPAGILFNALTLSLLERLTGYSVTFAQWTSTGVVLTAAQLPICYLVLKFMLLPEGRAISDGHALFRRQSAQLGPMSRAEKNVLFVLILMLVLWVLPTFATIAFLDIWYVPPVAMVLLFALPVDARRREATLTARDFQDGVAWNVLFLVLGGMALADVLAATGFTAWLAGMLTAGVTAGALPWLAGLVTPLLTQWANGAATSMMVSTMLFPIADTLGYNPAILARIIAGTAQAVALPWSSPAAAATFAFGAVGLGAMFRVGAVVTVLTSFVVIVVSMILVPALEAFVAG
ncbi:MAG: SLC13 family permease [Acidobacteria bacterium]|nr:SLC13 family permease [Acidobacteriota bacterium]